MGSASLFKTPPSVPEHLAFGLGPRRVAEQKGRSRAQEGPMKKYTVTLTAEERRDLHDLIAAGKAAAQKLAHARILLKADAAPEGPAWHDDRIAEAFDVSVATVERVRQRFVEQGLEAALGRKPQDRPSSTAGPRPGSSPWPARRRRRAVPPGRCNFWPTSSSSWRSSTRSPMRRCAGRSKKRAEALAEGAVVPAAGGERRVRSGHGRCSGRLPPALRPEATAGLPRRDEQAVDRRGGRAGAGGAGTAGADRLRVRPQRDGQPVRDLRAVGRVAARRGDRAADGEGLRRGGAVGGRRPAPRCREGGAGHGQPEHAPAGVAVRGVRAGAGEANRRASGGASHAEARQLAEHGGDRAERAGTAVPGPADRYAGGVAG